MDTNLERELQREREARRYAELDLVELREQQEREREAVERARRERRREQEEEWACQADSWIEALKKNGRKFRQQSDIDIAEASRYGIEPDPTHYFRDAADACAHASQIWLEVESSKQKEIAKLQAQIDAIVATIAPEVADRLESEANGRSGWDQVLTSLRTSTPQDFVNW